MRNSTLKLHPFQKDGVKFLTLDPMDSAFPVPATDQVTQGLTRYHKLLADDMGLGKTIQVAAALDAIGAVSTVVICPASVKIHWARKIIEWSDRPVSVFIVSNGKSKIPANANVIVVNYELLLQDKIYNQLVARGKNIGFDVVVMDEAHYLKTLTARRTKRVLGKTSFIHYAKYKWALTGTPILNRPLEIFPLLYTLAQPCIDPYISYQGYGYYFCNGRKDINGYNFTGASHSSELADRLKGFMLRRKKEDVLDQLPDTVETVIELNVVPPAGVESLPIATARKELALAKIPQAVGHIAGMLDETDKLVVFAHHRDVIEQLAKASERFNPVICYGGMTSDQKQASIDAFVNLPDTRLFIAQTQAGGTGVDGLQLAASHVVFIELDWSPGVMDQAKDRLRRIGQKNTVFVQYLAVPDSLDTQMSAAIERKRNVINKIILANEVTPMSNQTETIIQGLNAAAAALNALASALGGLSEAKPTATTAATPAVATVSTPTPKPAAAKKPTPAKTPAAAVEPEISEEVLRKECALFINAGPDTAANRDIINNVIWPMFGAANLKELDKSNYAAAMAELKKGPAAFATQGEDLGV